MNIYFKVLQPITLSWRDINVFAPGESQGCMPCRKSTAVNEEKHILKNGSHHN